MGVAESRRSLVRGRRALAALGISCFLLTSGCVRHAGKGPPRTPTSRTSPSTGRPEPLGVSSTTLPTVDRTTVSSTVRAQVSELVSHSVMTLSTQSGPSDPRYFIRGVWVSGQDDCFRCNVGPGVAAAALAGMGADKSALDLAIQTFDHAIAAHRQPDGGFGPPAPAEGGSAIQTAMVAHEP